MLMDRKKDKLTWNGRSIGEAAKTRRKVDFAVIEVCRKHSIDPSMLAR